MKMKANAPKGNRTRIAGIVGLMLMTGTIALLATPTGVAPSCQFDGDSYCYEDDYCTSSNGNTYPCNYPTTNNCDPQPYGGCV